jgi:hypothetical protein
VDRLSPYKGNEVNGQVPPPPEPVTVEGEEEYEVDHIRDSKLFGRTLKYLVRWCYGRLAVVSDLDDGGFALNVDKELRGSAVL